METTLILDEDVAATLERLRGNRNQPLNVLGNEALRRGLRLMTVQPAGVKPFQTQPVDLGRCLVASIDNVTDVLAIAEGESFK